VLGHGEERRDVVAGVRVLGGQESVVEIEFPDGDAVRPCCPLGRHPYLATAAEDGGTGLEQVGKRLATSAHDRPAAQGGSSHGGIVDQAVDHHLDYLGQYGDGVRRHFGQLPGQLLLPWQPF
jgi:hypothetical protein